MRTHLVIKARVKRLVHAEEAPFQELEAFGDKKNCTIFSALLPLPDEFVNLIINASQLLYSMERGITAFESYVHGASSINASQFEGINNYQSAPPLRHLPIPPEHSQCNDNNYNATVVNAPFNCIPPVTLNSFLPILPKNCQLSGNYLSQNHPIPIPSSSSSSTQARNKTKNIQTNATEKKRWNTADFRWMFTKRNGSTGT